MVIIFFFFKQKTAYEMRISDWSSDVCSSDLDREGGRGHHRRQQTLEPLPRLGQLSRDPRRTRMNLGADMMRDQPDDALAIGGRQPFTRVGEPFGKTVDPEPPIGVRSEEHTSELQSLMRISYAVFCLQKKKHKQH